MASAGAQPPGQGATQAEASLGRRPQSHFGAGLRGRGGRRGLGQQAATRSRFEGEGAESGALDQVVLGIMLGGMVNPPLETSQRRWQRLRRFTHEEGGTAWSGRRSTTSYATSFVARACGQSTSAGPLGLGGSSTAGSRRWCRPRVGSHRFGQPATVRRTDLHALARLVGRAGYRVLSWRTACSVFSCWGSECACCQTTLARGCRWAGGGPTQAPPGVDLTWADRSALRTGLRKMTRTMEGSSQEATTLAGGSRRVEVAQLPRAGWRSHATEEVGPLGRHECESPQLEQVATQPWPGQVPPWGLRRWQC